MKNIIDTIRRLWREICCVFLLTFLIYSFFIWHRETPEDQYAAWLLLSTNLLELALLFRLIISLWRRKWKKHFARGTQRLLSALTRFISAFFDKYIAKWLGHRRPQNIISGSSRITLDTIAFEPKPQRKKQVKWKNLKDERQRLGFIYRHMINTKLRAGDTAFPHDTPSEIRHRTENLPHEERLFELYVSSRYDERAELSEYEIAELKSKFEIK